MKYPCKAAVIGLFFLFICLAACAQQPKNEYKGRVVGISDGDTFTLLTAEKKQIKVRLSEIDTPESDQPFGTRAKQALSDLIFSKEVLVKEQDIDRYQRLVGHVYVGDVHVNRKMVQEGMAWVYRQYLKDQSLLKDEAQAKEAKKGLWSLPGTEQVPPWEWRRGNKSPKQGRTHNSGSSKESGNKQGFTCGSKTRCSEMTSCEEAQFYLKECGLSTIDGDKDGIPCERLCN